MAAYFELHQPRGRTRDHSISIREADESTVVTLAATDVVRVKVYSGDNETPGLDLLSGESSPNDSTVTVDNLATVPQVTLRLAQGDTSDWVLGVYDVDVIVVDDSESAPADAAKHAMSGLLYLTGTGGGGLGLTS